MTSPSAASPNARGRSRGQSGQSLVEFALMLPLALTLAMGVVDFGRAMYAYVAVSNAAQAGAEYATRDSVYNLSTVKNAVLWEGGAFLQSQAGSIVVSTDEENGGQMKVVVVTVTYDFTPITPLPFAGVIPIRATAAAPLRTL